VAYIYITLDEALAIHETQITYFGGALGVRDHGLIEAALLRPQTGYYGSLIEEAAALWESLTINHGFLDGNKRVAFACTDIFLTLNGCVLEAKPQEIIDFVYGNLEAGTFNKPTLEVWLTKQVRKIPDE
jgi:death-on-curing protein